jgi:hypothetical protein
MVRPLNFVFNRFITSFREAGSRALVGSSNMTTGAVEKRPHQPYDLALTTEKHFAADRLIVSRFECVSHVV